MLTAAAGLAHEAPARARGCFKIYDATLYAGKPAGQGPLQTLRVLEPDRWWPKGVLDSAAAHRRATASGVRALTPMPDQLVLDMELPEDGSAARTVTNLSAYRAAAQDLRQAGYTGSLGFYGLLPLNDYWGAVASPTSDLGTRWRSTNSAYGPLAASVDALYPSLYTFYGDVAGWQQYATAIIAESHRLAPDKPVYPFLWPQYHDSKSTLSLQYLDAAYWRTELETVYAQADGAVIWGGWDFAGGRPARWDEQAPWWRTLLEFMGAHSDTCPLNSSPTGNATP